MSECEFAASCDLVAPPLSAVCAATLPASDRAVLRMALPAFPGAAAWQLRASAEDCAASFLYADGAVRCFAAPEAAFCRAELPAGATGVFASTPARNTTLAKAIPEPPYFRLAAEPAFDAASRRLRLELAPNDECFAWPPRLGTPDGAAFDAAGPGVYVSSDSFDEQGVFDPALLLCQGGGWRDHACLAGVNASIPAGAARDEAAAFMAPLVVVPFLVVLIMGLFK